MLPISTRYIDLEAKIVILEQAASFEKEVDQAGANVLQLTGPSQHDDPHNERERHRNGPEQPFHIASVMEVEGSDCEVLAQKRAWQEYDREDREDQDRRLLPVLVGLDAKKIL